MQRPAIAAADRIMAAWGMQGRRFQSDLEPLFISSAEFFQQGSGLRFGLIAEMIAGMMSTTRRPE
jgi:hypothetical protein